MHKPGSVYAPTLSFGLHENAFERSDIPEKARKARAEVKASLREDILGLHKPPWNPSIQVPKRRILIHQTKEFCSIPPVYNFRAEALPKPSRAMPLRSTDKFHVNPAVFLPESKRPQGKLKSTTNTRVEIPTTTSLDSKPGWSSSTLVNSREVAKAPIATAPDVLRVSRKKAANLIGPSYVNPVEMERVKTAAMRAQKKAMAERVSYLRDLYGPDYEEALRKMGKEPPKATRLTTAVLRSFREGDGREPLVTS